ncbi:helicase HerA-like C-terminal domain-containing protein [Cohaesibacter celericrescens]|uniref:ATP-binding protein n=1 Tax=Cohaesibacter celericrescens TaxID=2067669 RepID=A0A2N5XRC2_9HYPH|nr:helicase HerA-like C-terminal domain-containing protein [Cohaesibacter celericrescens]PLW77010.1 ATP-binding protein [Cohaesibacter celericrescens]
MLQDDKVYLGTSFLTDADGIETSQPEYLNLRLANRHGLITGATGTGKTVSLQILTEGFSAAGVPVFCADVKGDLSGLAVAGEPKDFLAKRAEKIGFADEYEYGSVPTVFWDLFGEQGHPVRTTITDMGPLLLARLLGLNDTQEGVLNIAFKLADDEGMLLLDLKDLRSLLINMDERRKELSAAYGNISSSSIGAIQRDLLVLEQQGAEDFFGESALDILDLMRTTRDGRGVVSILAADKLMQSPRLYATFLLWLLSELFEELPEVGDRDRPRLVFFFDEAHLLFDDAPKILVEKVEQVVKLIRSKGVGVYFVTQNPLDVPDGVLSQLGNRVQHALRAFTPRDQKAVKVAADTFRPNPGLDTRQVIMEMGVGEALVSTLMKKGVPSMVQQTLIRPPSSRLGPLTPAERKAVINESPILGIYDKLIDRESAFEILTKKAEEKVKREEEQREEEDRQREAKGRMKKSRTGFTLPDFGRDDTPSKKSRKKTTTRRSNRQSVAETAMKSIARSVASSLGRALVRGILGSLKSGR